MRVHLLSVVSGVRHISCDFCRQLDNRESELRGIRWKCAVCYDYDLCHNCYMSDKHQLSHAFIRYDTPISAGCEHFTCIYCVVSVPLEKLRDLQTEKVAIAIQCTSTPSVKLRGWMADTVKRVTLVYNDRRPLRNHLY